MQVWGCLKSLKVSTQRFSLWWDGRGQEGCGGGGGLCGVVCTTG